MADETITQTTTPDLSTQEGQEAHFAAALSEAVKASDGEPEQSDYIETDPLTGRPLNPDDLKAAIQEQENLDAKIATDKSIEAEAQAEKVEDTETEDEEDKEEDDGEKSPSPGTLAKARRLFSEGNIAEALDLVGMPIDKIDVTTKQWKSIQRREAAVKEEVATAKAFVEQEVGKARHVVETLQPFVAGAQAYIAGDYETFLKLTTGDTPDEFQRKLIAQLHEAPTADPKLLARIEAVEKDRAVERAQAKAERDRLAQQNADLQYQQAVQSWKEGIKTELTNSEDPALVKLAGKQKFINQVFALQEERLNPRTHATIDTLEAAAEVYDEFGYGDLISEPAEGKVGKGTRASRANDEKNPALGTKKANKTTSLKNNQPGEAGPALLNMEWSKENQEKILEHFSRLAKSQMAATG